VGELRVYLVGSTEGSEVAEVVAAAVEAKGFLVDIFLLELIPFMISKEAVGVHHFGVELATLVLVTELGASFLMLMIEVSSEVIVMTIFVNIRMVMEVVVVVVVSGSFEVLLLVLHVGDSVLSDELRKGIVPDFLFFLRMEEGAKRRSVAILSLAFEHLVVERVEH